ncbi:tubulin polyglutamylase TTLL11 isoform X7 [Acinonyx jubatus]|uniref:Tubulin polyglutamylase TTLL11 isoform X7 n=1 Tax=Acinonyx jubatus TaxID=32536 RepID=A0ABM3NMI7_ACIJB|nr:tubulin polyglutamylase TTLL11 isoform X7 [Acinonyx jubatus]
MPAPSLRPGSGGFPPSSKMAAAVSVTGPITWAPPPMRSRELERRLSLPGPRPEAATALVNPSLSDHGNGLGRGARGSGGSGGSLVAGRGGGAAAAAVALALAPALSAMQRGSSERELAARWEAEAVAVTKAQPAAEQVRVDSGAAGEPERKTPEEQPKDPAPAQPRAAEEGDARVVPRPPPTLPPAKPQAARARGLCPHGKPRSKGRGGRRSSGRAADEYHSQRPVTVDSSKARTSLDALKISIRQLKWKEFPFGRRLPCDIYWHGVSFHDNDIFSGQVNKFPGMTEMVRKITLSRAVRIMQNLFPEEYNFYPRSWILPDEFQLFVAQILGFDILLMKNLKPILLEVNANPSMRIEHEQELSPGVFENVPSLVDEEVKVAVIRDTLRLMDPLKKKRENHFPDIYTDRKHRFPPVSDRMPSSQLPVVRSQQLTKPLAAKEDPSDSEPASASDGNTDPEAHLPSICLKQVFPKYAKQFNYLRLVDRMANLFIRFLGIKGTMKLGPTGFRTFIRNCKLSSSSLSMAAVDILYIDITRRWNSMTLDQRDSGMCLQAFVEAFFYLAQRKFKTLPLHEQVASLIDLCEYHLSLLDEKRLVCGRSGPAGGRPLDSGSPPDATPSAPPVEGHPPSCTNSAPKAAHSRHTLS